jgi:RHS repeat-associated protein
LASFKRRMWVMNRGPFTEKTNSSGDLAGNLTQFTDRRGKVSTYSYDALNRKVLAGFGSVMGTPNTYDSTISYSYDEGNRLASVVDSVAGTITPQYDHFDRLISEQTPQGAVSYDYDPIGRRTSMTVGGQPFVSYNYDDANRLSQIIQGSATVSFAYDAANRRTSLMLPNGITMNYSYDSGSQLTGIGYTNGGTTLGTLTYGYDLAGRRTSMGGTAAQTELPLAVSNTAYNANNQLTQWGTASLYYDQNGNMTSDGVNSLAWNARNQMSSMNSSAVSFQYDPYGRRSGKTVVGVTVNYLYDGANVAQEISGGSPIANMLSGGIDEVFTRTDSAGTGSFLTDALGSTLAITNGSGSTIASYAYATFGNTTVTSGSSTNEFQYTGRENDGTGLYFNRGRYYSPTLQRFISEDPIGISGGINLYAYVANNPIQFTDPLGLDKKQPNVPLGPLNGYNGPPWLPQNRFPQANPPSGPNPPNSGPPDPIPGNPVGQPTPGEPPPVLNPPLPGGLPETITPPPYPTGLPPGTGPAGSHPFLEEAWETIVAIGEAVVDAASAISDPIIITQPKCNNCM